MPIALALALGLLVSLAVTGLGGSMAAGLIGHPLDGQLPANWGWSFVMMGAACAFFFALTLWRRGHRGVRA